MVMVGVVILRRKAFAECQQQARVASDPDAPSQQGQDQVLLFCKELDPGFAVGGHRQIRLALMSFHNLKSLIANGDGRLGFFLTCKREVVYGVQALGLLRLECEGQAPQEGLDGRRAETVMDSSGLLVRKPARYMRLGI